MSSLRAATIPIALLLKLCHPDSEHHPPAPEHDASTASQTDAGSADAASEADAAYVTERDAAVTDPDASSATFDAGVDADVDASAGGRLDAMLGAEAGERAGDAALLADAAVAEVLSGPPGLYMRGPHRRLAEGVRPYEPRFALWADGADKERYVVLPPGAVIDAADSDLWRYPVGTRLYKTFLLDGRKLETRVMEKTSSGFGADAWSFRAYAWLADQSGVQLVEPSGRADVLGTEHDIPSVTQCRSCHSLAGQDAVNGFSALQLNHAAPGLTLAKLLAEGSLASPLGGALLSAAVVPGDAVAQAALGYLHSNCGNCHGGPTPRGNMTLRLNVGESERVEQSAVYPSVVEQPLRVWTGHTQADGSPITLRVAPGVPAASAVLVRMAIRGNRDQMPPIGSELPDPDGLAAVTSWVSSL